MRRLMAGLAGLALLLGGMAAAAQQRLSPECRAEVVKLCRGAGRGGFRECLIEKRESVSGQCRAELRDMRGARQAEAGSGAAERAYGPDARQKLDFYRAPASGVPLIVFVHGGGWSIGDKRHAAAAKAAHFNGRGYAFASVNYRLVPKATVEQQAADVAGALGWLRDNAAKLGFDGNRIILTGHSAGAHLAALVGSDTAYLEAAGVPLKAIRGVVLLDGAGYDVARQMAVPGNPVKAMYEAAFTRDPARQKALSPVTHAGAPNVSDWLILHVERRADARAQSNLLGEALRRGGVRVTVTPVPGATHMTINRDLGEAGAFVTKAIDDFAAARF